MPTEAQKRASSRYQKQHISSLACRVPKEAAERFKAYCEGQGKTVNGILREYVYSCIGEPLAPEDGTEAE